MIRSCARLVVAVLALGACEKAADVSTPRPAPPPVASEHVTPFDGGREVVIDPAMDPGFTAPGRSAWEREHDSAAHEWTTLSAYQIETVVVAHQADVRAACVDGGTGPITIEVTIANGKVVEASATGNPPAVARCLADQIRTWVFPATSAGTTVTIPFHYR